VGSARLRKEKAAQKERWSWLTRLKWIDGQFEPALYCQAGRGTVSEKELRQKSKDFTGQLEAYKNCLEEVGSLPVVSYVYYPVGGFVVGITCSWYRDAHPLVTLQDKICQFACLSARRARPALEINQTLEIVMQDPDAGGRFNPVWMLTWAWIKTTLQS
jgi:hypothetical protein